MKWNWIFVGAIVGALAVACGAFAAHGLKDKLTDVQMEWWKTGVLYHALHAPLIVLAGWMDRARAEGNDAAVRSGARMAATAFFFGVVIFSGTLYAMALGGPSFLGAITPVGGVLLIVGWILLALRGLRSGV